MNIFATNTAGAQLVAQQMIDERVRAAEQRRQARMARAERRAAVRDSRGVPAEHAVPWSAFRFLHPIH
jgi:hypothetical protein